MDKPGDNTTVGVNSDGRLFVENDKVLFELRAQLAKSEYDKENVIRLCATLERKLSAQEVAFETLKDLYDELLKKVATGQY